MHHSQGTPPRRAGSKRTSLAKATRTGSAPCAARSQGTPRRFERISTARIRLWASSVRSDQPGAPRPAPRAAREGGGGLAAEEEDEAEGVEDPHGARG